MSSLIRLGIVSDIDRNFPKRGQGASVGMYILIEAINRAAHPTSMANLEQWYAGTCLPLLTGLGAHLFSSQNFWNNTACLDVQTIQAVEDDMLRLVVHTYGLDAGEIVYDASNFFTYIDSSSTCECAQRGHDKAKRTDLKTVGLALMVAGDYAIPLLHETYPGNRADSIEFKRMMQSLKSRIQYITGAQATVTVVFDRGNNSEENMRLLEQGPVPCHYVGGLKRNQSADMFSIPKSGYTALDQDRFPGQSACRRRIKAYGRELTAVVVDNPNLLEAQLRGILANVGKANAKLLGLQQRLLLRAKGEISKGAKPTRASVGKAVKHVLRHEYMERLFTYEIIEKDDFVLLTFAQSPGALDILCEQELGKTVLFTDRDELTNEQIVCLYRSAWHVESGFRQMKDTSHLHVRPIFHWKDSSIAIHMFTCVLAYRLCCLLRMELARAGVSLSITKILEEMSKLKSITTFFGEPGKPEKVHSFTVGSELTQRIEQVFNLKKTYPVR